MSKSNGHNTAVKTDTSMIVEVPVLEFLKDEINTNQAEVSNESEQPKPKTTRKRNSAHNKGTVFNLDIDAGAKNVKARLNGELITFPSEFKIISGDVPLNDNGCFVMGDKNYVVGKSVNRVNGKLHRAADNKKLTSLDVWIVGAITHFRKQLRDAVKNRQRKSESTFIMLNIRILTLSSLKRKDLEKAIKSLEKFNYEDNDFTISVKSIEFKDEAFGAGLEVAHTEKLSEFGLLDLGGGTLTYSNCRWDGESLQISQRPVSGGGMGSIMDSIYMAVSRTDKGSSIYGLEGIQYALKLSSINDGKWCVPLRIDGKDIDISNDVDSALSEWVLNNCAVHHLLDSISQEIRSGYPVFCTGGGFASAVVAHWIIERLSDGIVDSQIKVLPNPEKINMVGLKWLDAPIEAQE